MNYYNEIKNEIINNEVYKNVKDYYEEFRHKLTEKFGKKIAENLILPTKSMPILMHLLSISVDD